MPTDEPFAKDAQTYLMQKYGMPERAAALFMQIVRERDMAVHLTISSPEFVLFANAFTKFAKWIGI